MAGAHLFGDLIEKGLLPEGRADDCRDEYRQVAYAIATLMSRNIDAAARDRVLAKDWVGGRLRKKTAGDAAPR